MGDGLLAEAAKRLQESVRDENTVARLGDDEFVVLLDIVASIADAALMAERIARQFDRPFTFESRDFTVTASIGIALGGAGHEEQVDSLLRNADIAMYRAKAGGKARYVAFDSSMQPVVEEIRRHREALDFIRDQAVRRRQPITVDLVKRLVVVRGEEVHLTPIEYKLLTLLVKHAGMVMTQA